MIPKIFFNLYRIFSSIGKWGRTRFTPTGKFILCGLATAAITGLSPSRTLMYQVFAFLFFLVLCSMLASLFSRGSFQTMRFLPRFVTVGAPLSYKVRVHNRSGKPQTGLSLQEHLMDLSPDWDTFRQTGDPKGKGRGFYDQSLGLEQWLYLRRKNHRGAVGESALPPMRAGETVEVQMELVPLRRGYLRFRQTAVACPDPFGLYRALHRVPAEQSVLILPRIYPVRPIQLPGKRAYHQYGVTLASNIGESEEFVGLREYRPGDPIRNIHWRSWAKCGKPVVKQFQEEFFSRQALIFDTFIQEDETEQFEEAVSVAASFINNIELGDSLLDLMFVGTEAYCFTSGRSLGSQDRMLEILAAVEICREHDFSYLTRQVMNRASLLSGCICVLLGWDTLRQELVRRLRGLNLPVLVLVVLGRDAKEPERGPMEDHPDQFHVLKVGQIAEGLETV